MKQFNGLYSTFPFYNFRIILYKICINSIIKHKNTIIHPKLKDYKFFHYFSVTHLQSWDSFEYCGSRSLFTKRTSAFWPVPLIPFLSSRKRLKMALQNIGACASNRLAKVMNIGEKTGTTTLPKDSRLPSLKEKVMGIKTNNVDIPEVLGRPASYTTSKYFGCELGAQSKYDYKMRLLNSIESFCWKQGNEEAVKEFASGFKEEIIEEEFVLKWYQKGLTAVYKSSHVWNNVKLICGVGPQRLVRVQIGTNWFSLFRELIEWTCGVYFSIELD